MTWLKVADPDREAAALVARLRDGDNCRLCGGRVIWVDRHGPAGATFLHFADTPEALVVVCRGCRMNFARREPLQFLPAPRKPFLSADSLKQVQALAARVAARSSDEHVASEVEWERGRRRATSVRGGQRPVSAAPEGWRRRQREGDAVGDQDSGDTCCGVHVNLFDVLVSHPDSLPVSSTRRIRVEVVLP